MWVGHFTGVPVGSTPILECVAVYICQNSLNLLKNRCVSVCVNYNSVKLIFKRGRSKNIPQTLSFQSPIPWVVQAGHPPTMVPSCPPLADAALGPTTFPDNWELVCDGWGRVMCV